MIFELIEVYRPHGKETVTMLMLLLVSFIARSVSGAAPRLEPPGKEKFMVRILSVLMIVMVGLALAGVPSLSAVEEGYSIPLIAPEYPAPPYALNTKAMVILFSTTPEAIRKTVPEPLVPNPGNLMFVIVQKVTIGGAFSYNEMILGAPVTFKGKSVNYFAYLLLDRAEAISGGREIWGFPKKFGQITIEEKDGKITARASRWGATLIEAAVELARPVPPGSEGPVSSGVNLKLIPSVKAGAPPDVKQLTSTVAEGYKLHQAKEGPATLSLGGSPFDPLNRIPVKSVLGGRYIISDSTLTYGEVLYDYLKEK
jgi:acetoacetate decarboxylase